MTVILSLSLGFLVTMADAGDDEPTIWKRTWRVEAVPLTKRIAIVLDVSGSMRGEPIGIARDEILRVLSLFPDDGHVKLYAFSDDVLCLRDEWSDMPDGELLDAAEVWLHGFSGAGNTALADAVVAALGNEDEDLTVLLITDGEPTGEMVDHLARMAGANGARARRAPVHVIGVLETDQRDIAKGFLEAVAKQNGGGLLLIEKGSRVLTAH